MGTCWFCFKGTGKLCVIGGLISGVRPLVAVVEGVDPWVVPPQEAEGFTFDENW